MKVLQNYRSVYIIILLLLQLIYRRSRDHHLLWKCLQFYLPCGLTIYCVLLAQIYAESLENCCMQVLLQTFSRTRKGGKDQDLQGKGPRK